MLVSRVKTLLWHISLLAVAFLASRGLALLLGVRPLTSETVWFMQFLDLDLLQHHLIRSLWHLHGQPPLLNALVGICEKLAGQRYGDLIAALYSVLGLASTISVYLSLRLLRVSPTFSLAIGLCLLLNPFEILSEFDPIYTVPVFALLSFIALATVCYLQSRSTRALSWLVGLAVTLTLLRSPYQWMWVLALLAILWWQSHNNRVQVRTAAFTGLFLVMLWPAKNAILFHHFTSTTWAPFSIAKHWDWNGPAVQSLVRQGQLTTFAPPDNSDEAVSAFLQSEWQTAPTGYPELDDVTKKTGGAVNWNSLAGLRLNDGRQADLHLLLRRDPKEFVTSVLHSAAIYFYPSSQYFTMFGESDDRYRELTHHYIPLRGIDRSVRRFCCNIFGLPADTSTMSAAQASHPQEHRSAGTIIKKTCVGALLLDVAVLLCMISFFGSSLWSGAPDRKVAAMIMTMTIIYSFLVNFVEFGENERYRYETQALVFMVVAIFLQQILDSRRNSRSNLGMRSDSSVDVAAVITQASAVSSSL